MCLLCIQNNGNENFAAQSGLKHLPTYSAFTAAWMNGATIKCQIRRCGFGFYQFNTHCEVSNMSCNGIQARKRHININFFVRLVLGRPRVCPRDFTAFVPGTNSVKTSYKPGFSPYFTQWKPGKPRDKPGFVLGPKGGTESLCEKSLCAFFAR